MGEEEGMNLLPLGVSLGSSKSSKFEGRLSVINRHTDVRMSSEKRVELGVKISEVVSVRLFA